MTAVERIHEYTLLPIEPLKMGRTKPSAEWPQVGAIRFEHVYYRYDENSSYVLNDLTFNITGGEKIGIVGRTGAGKSSLIQAIFRMAEVKGKILIDNVNTRDIGLQDLRSKLSIIPVKIKLT